MLDAELKIADAVTVDISAATDNPAPAFTLNRRGFPDGASFVVVITNTSADNTIDPVRFDLEVTIDGGTTWHPICSIHMSGNGSLSKAGPYSVPIPEVDMRVDERATAANIQCRVRVTLATTGSTDDFTYDAYIGTGNPYPAFSALGVYNA